VGFKRVGVESKYENTSKIEKGIEADVSCLLVACVGCCLLLSTGSGVEVAHSGYSFAMLYCVGVPLSVTRPL